LFRYGSHTPGRTLPQSIATPTIPLHLSFSFSPHYLLLLSPLIMGGGSQKYPYPSEVWSPAGGWWANPSAWRRNTGVAFLVSAAVLVPVFLYGEKITERRVTPSRQIPWRKSLGYIGDADHPEK